MTMVCAMNKVGWSSILVAAMLLTVAVVTEAQQGAKTPRIGMLLANSVSASTTRVQAMQQGLRELAYVEGKNISIEYRYANGKLEPLGSLWPSWSVSRSMSLSSIVAPPLTSRRRPPKQSPLFSLGPSTLWVKAKLPAWRIRVET